MRGIAGTMRSRRLWALAPSTGLFLFLFAAPLTMLFVVSFWSKKLLRVVPDFTLANYVSAVERYGDVALNTLGIAAGTAIATTVLAFLFAYVIRFKAGRYGDALLFVSLITLFGGYLVKVYAWKTILGREGILNSALLGIGIIDEPIGAFIYNAGAVVVALVHFLLPLALLPVYASMRNVADITLEAARDLGARPWQVVLGVVLPQCRAGLLAALIFTFLIAVGDYVTPQFLGGTTGSMIGVFIGNQFSIRFDWPLGSAMSFTLLAVCLALVVAARFALWRSPR